MKNTIVFIPTNGKMSAKKVITVRKSGFTPNISSISVNKKVILSSNFSTAKVRRINEK